MALNRGLFVRNVGTTGTTPIESRSALQGLFAHDGSGNVRSGLLEPRTSAVVIPSNTSLLYGIRPMTLVYQRAAGEGVYLVSTNGNNTNVTPPAAPTSGSRYDLVWVKQNDPDKGDVAADGVTKLNTAVAGVTSGDAAASPSKPYSLVPSGATVLAEVLVPTNAANAGQTTITQAWNYAAFAGDPIPVRSQAERDAIVAYSGMRVQRLDDGARIELYTNGAWTQPHVGPVAWTPAFTNGASVGAGYATGDYVLQGKLCTFRADFAFGVSGSNGTGNANITLPFPASSARPYQAVTGHMEKNASGTTALGAISARIMAGASSTAVIYAPGASQLAAATGFAVSGSYLSLSGSYLIA